MIASVFQNRIAALQKTIEPNTGVLLANPQHIEYLTGFKSLTSEEREAFLLITDTQTTLFYASFSPVAELSQVNYVRGCSIAAVLSTTKALATLAVDMDACSAQEFQDLAAASKLTTWQSETIWQQRMHKDKQELSLITRAVEITTTALEQTLATLAVDATELEVCRQLDAAFLLAGADGCAFPTIVAFGEHTALPHHQPTEKKLEKEMAVLIDCGAKVGGYCADMTRTIWFGEHPDPEFVKIDAIVHEAFESAKAALRQEKPTAQSVDAAARQVIAQAGFGEQFIHTTGHGLGLSIHEPPSLSERNEQVLKPGMVITIEPGIYLVGRFGVRFEETVTKKLSRSLPLPGP